MTGRIVAILVAAGRGERLGAGTLKPLRPIGGVTLLERSLRALVSHPSIDGVVVALPAAIVTEPPACLTAQSKPVRVVAGGERRQDSVERALAATADDVELVVVHDAARPFVTADVITRTIEAARESGAAVAALPARETVKLVEREADDASGAAAATIVASTLDRRRVALVQTPQAFRRRVLQDAFAKSEPGIEATDEAGLAERAGHPVRVVDGDPLNIKVTVPDDLVIAEAIAGARDGRAGARRELSTAGQLRIGNGYDNHRLVEGRRLVLGGVHVPFDRGLLGHSDADAVCHAVTDAILGAAAEGDIGRHFPDSDPRFAGASSLDLLRAAAQLVGNRGCSVVNVDVTVIAERPKIAPHVDQMRANLATALGIAIDRVSVKGKTNESVDAVGRGEAIAAHAVALLETP